MDQTTKRRIDTSKMNLKRTPPDRLPDKLPPEPKPVSGGPVDRVIDLAFNPSREKMREVTIIDRMQGRLFPVLDTINSMFQDCIEVAAYRTSREKYKVQYDQDRPIAQNILDNLLFRTAQWQKSVQGKNLQSATDIALAETETRTDDNLPDQDHGRGYSE